MVRYFADTSAFYASKDPSDRRYAEAVAFMEQVRRSPNVQLLTSNFIVDETLTLLRKNLGHQAAVQFGQQIRESKIVEVVHITESLEERAWQIFVKYSDKDYSFTDCTSFAVIEERSLSDAFAFDKHFIQHGLIVFP